MSFQFRNDSGETIPPYAVMKHTSTVMINGEPMYVMEKPSGEYQRIWFINGPASVLADAYGECFTNLDESYILHPVLVSGSPAFGEQYGPVPDQWYIAAGGLGLEIKSEVIQQGGSIAVVLARQREVTQVECVNTASVATSLSSTAPAVLMISGSTVNFTLTIGNMALADEEIEVNTDLLVLWLDKWRVGGKGCSGA